MLGFIVSVAFQNVTIIGGQYSPWRWMLGSTSIPPLVVCIQVYFCPESPRCKSASYLHGPPILTLHEGTWKKANSTRHSHLFVDFASTRCKRRGICTTPTSSLKSKRQSAKAEMPGRNSSLSGETAALHKAHSSSCLCNNSAASM